MMIRRFHPLLSLGLTLALVGIGRAQDISNIWNAAKRVKLGLDKSVPMQQVPAGAAATQNPPSPPNTPDIQVFNPSQYWQSENSIGVNFSNPNQLMVSTNGLIPGAGPVVEQTWAFSTDGGFTWPTSMQSEFLPPGIVDCFGDPVAFFDLSGRAYFVTLGAPGGIYVVSTTNSGATWSARSDADNLSSTNNDKEHATADYSGLFPDNIYAAWTDFGIASAPVVFARSTNQGTTWQPRVLLGISSFRGQGAHIAIGPNGEVYVVWAHYATDYQEAGLGFAKSTDGGATFSTPVLAYSFTGIRSNSIPQLNNTRAASFPYSDVDRSNGPRRGWIYTVHPQLVGGQADVFLHRSTDGGASWSDSIRVNGPDVEPGKWQWMASIAVDPTSGGISVSYYSMDSVGFNFMTNRYVAYSNDGGDTWDNFVVSDVRALWAPQVTPGGSNYNGDYYETAAMNGKAWPCWTDRRLGPASTNNRAYVQPVNYSRFFGWVKGTVTNLIGGAPLSGAYVDFTDYYPPGPWWGTTDTSGFYLVGAEVDTPGTTQNVTLRARKFGFRDTLQPVTLIRDDTLTRNFAMTPVPTGTLVVRTVRRDSVNIRSGITVFFYGQILVTGTTDSLTGIFSTILPAGNYDVLVDPPSPYGNRRFNNVAIASGSNPLYVVVRPVIENTPAAMRDTVALGQVHTKILTLTNTTGDTIPYRVSDDNDLARKRLARPAAQPRSVPIIVPQRPKGARDIEFGSRPTGGGGPDAFGYRWVDSDSSGGGVTYNWVDVTSVGTPVTTWTGSTDDGSFSTTLPWPFPFYGNSYTNFFFTTNGWLGFNTPGTEYSNTAIPSVAEPNNAIYAWWDDLQAPGTSGDGTVYYYNDVTNSRYIVEYNNVRHLSATTDTLKFEAILKPNGEILLQYNHMVSASNLTSATIGIENADGSIGLQVLYNALYVHDHLAVRLYFPDASWIFENPSFGRLNPGASQDVVITFDASFPIQLGMYRGHLIIDAIHPDLAGPLLVPASMRVVSGPPPGLIVQPDSLDCGNVTIGRTDSSKSVLVRNYGTSTVTVSNVTFTGSPGFSTDRTAFSLFPSDTLRLKVMFTAASPGGVRTARMNFVCNDPVPPFVGLRAVSVGVSHIEVRPDTFSFTMTIRHDTTRSNFRVINTGTDTVHYVIKESTSPAPVHDSPSMWRSRLQRRAYNLPKGAVDPTPGEVDSSGGPDAFGYLWIDSDSPGGPTYDWVDISTVGTRITSWIGSADDGYATVPFPFSFPFYDTTFSSSVNVCTNGFLSFTSTLTSFQNLSIPDSSAPLNGIFPFWDDQDLRTGGQAYYYSDVANNRFVVEYLNVYHYSSGGPYTYEVIFRPDGTILYQYLAMDPTLVNSSTVGIQNADGTIGLQVVFNANYLHDNLAVLITSDVIPWMSTDKTSGIIAPGDSTAISLRVHPAPPLLAGDYVGYQRVTTTAFDTASVRVRLRALPFEPFLTVTSPNGGEQWVRGQTYPITWTGTVDSVRIEFSTSGTAGPWILITPGVPGKIGLQRHPKYSAVPEKGGEWDNPNGMYNWLIPANTPPSANCFVRVSWKSNPALGDISDAAFTIQALGDDTSWVVQTSGTTMPLYCVKAVDNSVAWAGGGTGAGVSGIVLRTINGGSTWTSAGVFAGDVYTITALDANTAIAANYAITYTRLLKTTSGGVSWRTVDSIAGVSAFYDNIRMFDVNNGIAQGDPVGGYWVIKKTTDGGNTWVPVSPALPQAGAEGGWQNAMDFVGTYGWFGTNNSRIYRTSDGGSTWTSASTTFVNSFSVAFSRLDAGLAGGDLQFDKSTDAGATWTAVPPGLNTPAVSMWANPNSSEFWMASGPSVLYSPNFGASWSALPPNGCGHQANDLDMVRMGSGLYGWLVGNAGTIVRFRRTAVGVEVITHDIPTVFALSQNYPNPFNPSTTIKYDLPVDTRVTLKVFNIIGQEVATLVNGEQKAGHPSVEWNAGNLASGVYLYRLEAGSFTSVKKLLLLR